MDIAAMNQGIIDFMQAHPELADEIKAVQKATEKAARGRGMGALDAMSMGHNAVIGQFPELRDALGISEDDARRAQEVVKELVEEKGD